MDCVLEELFKNKRHVGERLAAFGFSFSGGTYKYSTDIFDGQFKLIVEIGKSSAVKTEVIENASGEKFTLHLVHPDMNGPFVGRIKKEYARVLSDMAENCFEPDVFKSAYSRRTIEYVWKKYADAPQFLWKKFPSNAVFRRKDNGKWYGAILSVSKRKIGLESDEQVEILDLRAGEEIIGSLVDGKRYFRGYHMNKRHWITICMDGSVSMREIRQMIDASYKIAEKGQTSGSGRRRANLSAK